MVGVTEKSPSSSEAGARKTRVGQQVDLVELVRDRIGYRRRTAIAVGDKVGGKEL